MLESDSASHPPVTTYEKLRVFINFWSEPAKSANRDPNTPLFEYAITSRKANKLMNIHTQSIAPGSGCIIHIFAVVLEDEKINRVFFF